VKDCQSFPHPQQITFLLPEDQDPAAIEISLGGGHGPDRAFWKLIDEPLSCRPQPPSAVEFVRPTECAGVASAAPELPSRIRLQAHHLRGRAGARRATAVATFRRPDLAARPGGRASAVAQDASVGRIAAG
jgi:hypothetical protein